MLHVAAYKGCLQNLHSLHQNSDSQFVKYSFLFAALCSKKKNKSINRKETETVEDLHGFAQDHLVKQRHAELHQVYKPIHTISQRISG